LQTNGPGQHQHGEPVRFSQNNVDISAGGSPDHDHLPISMRHLPAKYRPATPMSDDRHADIEADSVPVTNSVASPAPRHST
jgi:hypothetical protein